MSSPDLQRTTQEIMQQLDKWRYKSPVEDLIIKNLRRLGGDLYMIGGFGLMQEVYRVAREEFSHKGPDNPYAILDRAWEGVGGWVP